jgi:putative protein-disulfide isomerase
MWEFEGELEFVWVMAGLARRYDGDYRDEEGGIGSGASWASDLVSQWLEVSALTRMPFDPRIWTENPPASSYPACMAVKAAAEQGPEVAYRYLRRLREGLMLGRRKLDHADSLVAEAGPAGLDVESFRVDLGSHAITEAFAADLDEVRAVPAEARSAGKVRTTEGKDRVALPSTVFAAEDGPRSLWGPQPYEALRDAALAAGARQVNDGPLEPLAAVERFGSITTREGEELTQRPAPVVEAELWKLATEWKLKPVRALTGTLWEPA